MIDISFRHIVKSICEHGFDTLYYQISDQKEQLDIGIRVFEEHPFVNNTVVQYIMNKIYKMTTEPIRLIVKR